MAGARLRPRRAAVLLVAVALDLALAEPPARVHPVVWLGQAVAALERRAPRQGRARQFWWGVAVAAGVPVTAALAGVLAERATRRLGPAGLPAEALLLKSAFAVRALLVAGGAVQTALLAGEDEAAREALRSLVSRDTAGLGPPLLAAAAIESLAENTTDSFLAPWLAYALAGLPGALAYRAVNTLDSMLGHRGRYEYLGKAAARLDDLVNLLPARLAALALALSAPAGGGSVARALRGIVRDRNKTASPNAGWTIAAMAGALGVRLEKVGVYVVGDDREPQAADVERARRTVVAAAGLGLALTPATLVRVPRVSSRGARQRR